MPIGITAQARNAAATAIAGALGLDLGYAGFFPLQRDVAKFDPAFAALAQPAPEPAPAPVLVGPAHP